MDKLTIPVKAQNLNEAVTLTPTAKSVGVQYTVTVRAVDDYFNTVTAYTDNVSITTSDPNDTDPAAKAFTAGVATFNITNYTASNSLTITPSSGTLVANDSSPLVVKHGAPTSIIVKLPGQTHVPGKQTLAEALTGSPTARTVNAGYNAEVYAVDDYFNICTAASGGTSVAGTSHPSPVRISDTEPDPANFLNGGTSFVVTHRTAGTNQTLTPTHGGGGTVPGTVSSTYTINPGAAVQMLVKLPGQTHNPGYNGLPSGAVTGGHSALTAGTAFDVEVMAVDGNYNIVPTHTGTVKINFGGEADQDEYSPVPATTAFTSGVATIAVTHYRAAHNDTYNITPQVMCGTARSTNTSIDYTVSAGAATKLLTVLGFERFAPGALSLANATPFGQGIVNNEWGVGDPMSITAYAVDNYYNRVYTETGSVTLTTTDPDDTNPTSANLVQGAKTFSITPIRTGTWKVQSSYTGGATLTHLDSDDYEILPALPQEVVFAVNPDDASSASDVFGNDAVVHVLDTEGNIVTNYTSAVRIDVFTDDQCTVAATGRFEVNLQSQVPTNGVATFSAMAYRRAENIYFKASSTYQSTPLQSACTVSPTVVSPGSAVRLVKHLAKFNIYFGNFTKCFCCDYGNSFRSRCRHCI